MLTDYAHLRTKELEERVEDLQAELDNIKGEYTRMKLGQIKEATFLNGLEETFYPFEPPTVGNEVI